MNGAAGRPVSAKTCHGRADPRNCGFHGGFFASAVMAGCDLTFGVFHDGEIKKVRRNGRWSGYYFERMIDFPVPHGEPANQLWAIVERIRDPQVRALNKFELSLFDPIRDVDNSPYGGQCLSFLSFKLIPGEERTLALTAMYRNHFYVVLPLM
jgi:hypothetical protein